MIGPRPNGANRACARPIVLPSLTATARSAARPPLNTALTPTSIGFEANTSPARERPRTRKLALPDGWLADPDDWERAVYHRKLSKTYDDALWRPWLVISADPTR